MPANFCFKAFLIVTILLACPMLPAAEEVLRAIQLPAPQTAGGRPLMQVLKDRHSYRDFSAQNLPDQMFSNLLWAAYGVNRPDSGGRTAPSARNWQETDIYVARYDGLFLYDAKANELKPVLPEDIRGATGLQPFVKDAPVNLVFVADYSKMGKNESDNATWSAADASFISQNVYLFCASEGLATVVRGMVDRPTLAKAMGLRDDQRVVLAQSVGYPQASVKAYGN